MKFNLVLSLFAAASLGLSACVFKAPEDPLKDLNRKISEIDKENEERMKQIEESMTKGGQPGKVRLSGFVVNKDQPDSRIAVVVNAGHGKDGKAVEIVPTNQPVYAAKVEKIDLTDMTKTKDLFALGCDEKVVANFADEQELQVVGLPEPISENVMIVSANTIIFCGKIEKLNYNFLTIIADKIILDSAVLEANNELGNISIAANKLRLQGANSIVTKAPDSSMTVLAAPAVEVSVLKELSSSADGKLLIKTSGSNYLSTK